MTVSVRPFALTMFNPKLSHSLPAGGRNSGTIIAAYAVASASATAVTSALPPQQSVMDLPGHTTHDAASCI